MVRRSIRAAIAVLLAVVLSSSLGCVFSKKVYNPGLQSLDPSIFAVGETTVMDVLEKWGGPPMVDETDAFWLASPDLFRRTRRNLRYVTRVEKCVSRTMEDWIWLPYRPALPFRWCDDQPARAIVLEFDEAGLMKRATAGEIEVLWRPWPLKRHREITIEMVDQPGERLQ